MVRKLEIVAIVVVITVSLVVGFYLALFLQNPRDALDNKPVPQSVYLSFYQTSKAPYGASGSAYLKDVQNLTGTLYTKNGKPIVVFVGADYCLYCAIQRWSLIMALMRFGNFTNLGYMTSSVGDGDYSTFTLSASNYTSNYLVFQPYELYDRGGVLIATLPTNYNSSFYQYGKAEFPFLDFANRYYISGSILSNPGLLGTKNWTQVISSIQAGDTLGSPIKQAANVITAVICRITGNEPASVCGQASITALTVAYTPSLNGSGSELFLLSAPSVTSPSTFTVGHDHRSWN